MLPLVVLAVSVGSTPPKSTLRAGVLVGDPIAITVATDLAEGLALHSEVGVSPRVRTSALVAMDVVYRAQNVFGPLTSSLWAMPFFGLGFRAAIGERDQPDRLGMRVPFGVTVLDRVDPLELFIQCAVGLSFFPDRRGSIDIGAGIRFGF